MSTEEHTQKEDGLISDEPVLSDSKPPAKLPWILAAIGIVILVVAMQLGGKYLFQRLTTKKEAQAAMMVEDEREEKSLPMPSFKKPDNPKVALVNPPSKINVMDYLQSKKVERVDEIERLAHLEKMANQRRRHDEEERMLKSSALIAIGVRASSQTTADPNPSSSLGDSQNSNIAYLNRISNQAVNEVNAGQFGDLRFRIRKGKVLRGVTESAIDSDLPGLIRGHLTENVYGDQGDTVLLPNGAGLIGEYRSGGISNGQASLFVVWTRVQLSNGVYVTIDSPNSDPVGRAGMAGPVDHHYLQRFGSAFLSSFFSVSIATLGVHSSDQYNSETAYRQGLSNSFAQTANQEFRQYAAIQNTIRPPQGTEITILVNKDISFEGVLSAMESQS